MKVFVSWSGPTSQRIAEQIRSWLPLVIQQVEPFVSKSDIDAGARWNFVLSSSLQECQLGILCVTADNIDAHWPIFEAGALSKSVGDSLVVPILFGVTVNQLPSPLSQFQAKTFDRAGVYDVVLAINKALKERSLPDLRLAQTFEAFWPSLDHEVKQIIEENALPSVQPAPPSAVDLMLRANQVLDVVMSKLDELEQKIESVASDVGTIEFDVGMLSTEVDSVSSNVDELQEILAEVMPEFGAQKKAKKEARMRIAATRRASTSNQQAIELLSKLRQVGQKDKTKDVSEEKMDKDEKKR